MSSHLCRGICIWETPAMVAVAAPMLPNNAFFWWPPQETQTNFGITFENFEKLLKNTTVFRG